MKNKSNITVTDDGFVEKSSGRKIVSPLDIGYTLRLEAMKAVSKTEVDSVQHLLVHTDWVYNYLISGKMPTEKETSD